MKITPIKNGAKLQKLLGSLRKGRPLIIQLNVNITFSLLK